MSGKSGGIQAILQERLHRSIPYIHCFNHRLHLIVMHVCDNLDYVWQYFDTCRLVNKFLSKFKVMMVFKNVGGSARPKLLEHRWSGHHFVAKLLVEKYDIIAKKFDHFVSIDLSNAELTITATGLLTTIRRRKFRFVGSVMKEMLSIIKPADKALQSSSCSLFSGFQIVTGTIRELEKMRSDERWNKIMDVIPEHEGNQERAARRRRVKRCSTTSTMDQNFIFTESFGARDQSDNVNQVLKPLCFEIMDTTIAEFLRRFSQFNSCLMTSLSALIPASSEFLKAETIKPLCELVNTTDSKWMRASCSRKLQCLTI